MSSFHICPHGPTSKTLIFLLCLLLFAGQIALFSRVILVQASSAEPTYATPNAFADYQIEGGFVPFFDGVNATFDYNVTAVYGNGSMNVYLVENISQGTEVPTTGNVSVFLDSVVSPIIFPAVSASALGTNRLIFDNVSCTFVRNFNETVPAGTFNTEEYSGTDSNGTQLHFYIDRASGLAVEMDGGGALEQLTQSNIATPISVPSGTASSIPYVEVFAFGWVLAAIGFLTVRRHYNKKAARLGPVKNEKQNPEKAKSGNLRKS